MVPEVALIAMKSLSAGKLKKGDDHKAPLNLIYRQGNTTYTRPFWPTPRSKNWRTCNVLTYRTLQDLATAVKFEKDTKPGRLNISWVEWLQGYPQGWTERADASRRTLASGQTESHVAR